MKYLRTLELIVRYGWEKCLNFWLLGTLEFPVVLFEGDETSIEEGALSMREDYTGDLFILHIILEEFFDEFFADFMIVHFSEKFTKARGSFGISRHAVKCEYVDTGIYKKADQVII